MKQINKVFLLLAFMLSMWQAKSQGTCTTAVGIGTQNAFHSFTSTSATDEWLSFTAPRTGNVHQFALKVYISGMSSSPSYSLTLYNGSCPTKTIASQFAEGVIGDTLFYYGDIVPTDTTYQVHVQNNNSSPSVFSGQILYMVDESESTCSPFTYTAPSPTCELVYNGDFETHHGTPQGYGSIVNCSGWYNPTAATPDSYSTSYGGASGFGIPPCINTGYQSPHSGGGFAGIATSTVTGNYSEYIETKLLAPLQAGKIYQISMYVSRADVAPFNNGDLSVYLIGSSFCASSYGGSMSALGSISPKVSFGSSYLNDCTNWVKLSANYCAAGGEEYLMIGDNYGNGVSGFCSASNSPTTCTSNGPGPYSYLYIDDVSIKKLDLSLASPYVTCAGNTLNYAITSACSVDPNAGLNYNWIFGDSNTASTTVGTEPHVFSSAGTFSGSVTYSISSAPTCSVSLPFVTTVSPVYSSLTVTNSKPLICDGTNSILSAVTTPSAGNFSYQWQPGSATTSSIAVSPTTTVVYTLTVTDNDCALTRTVTTTVTGAITPVLSVSFTPGVCTATTAASSTLAASGASTYTWSPGGANTASISLTPTVVSVYTVSSNNSGCAASNTIQVVPVMCCHSGSVIAESVLPPLAAGVYSIDHPVTVTSSYTLTNVTIFMGSNAEIIVNNGVTLDIRSSHLLGCPNMWKGIRYVGTSGTILMSKNVMIEDAITAIDLTTVTAAASGSFIIVSTDATFNKNLTGVSIGTYTNTTAYPAGFGSTVFTCRRLVTDAHSTVLGMGPVTYTWNGTNGNHVLKNTNYTPSNANISAGTSVDVTDDFSASTYTTCNLEIPYTNTFSHYGIKMDGVGITNTVTLVGFKINGSGTEDFTTMNLFDNLGYGIYATNSNVSSKNCAYQYMRQYQVPSQSGGIFSTMTYTGGVGIYCENDLSYPSNYPTKLEVVPTTAAFNKTTNFFFHNVYGVKTLNVQYADIEYAMIHSSRTNPVSTPSGQTAMGEYGIYIQSSDYRNINVVQNVATNVGTGITFNASYITKTTKIPLQYVGPVTLSNNRLQSDYTSTPGTGYGMTTGIVADNVVNCYTCTAVGSYTSPILTNNNLMVKVYNGIESNNWQTQATSASSNTITLLDNGYSGVTQRGILHQNDYGDYIFNNSVTGFNTTKRPVFAVRMEGCVNQTVTCNSTSTTYEGFYFTGAANLTAWKNNNMTSHIHAMDLYNSVIGQQGTSTNGTSNTWSGTWTGGNYQTWVQGGDPAANNSDMYFVSAGLPTYNGSNILTHQYKVSGLPSLFTASSSSGLSCPITTYTAVSLPHHLPLVFRQNLIDIAAETYTYSPFLSENVENGRYAVYRELVADTSLMAGSHDLNSLYADGNSGVYHKFDLAENDLFNIDNTTAATQVSAMSPGTTIEQNTKNFYSIFLKTKDGSYAAADDSTLLALANACPTRDGKVVYQARVLYNALYSQSILFDNACDTVTVGAKAAAHNDLANSPANANFIVYPNPNNGTVYLSADNIGLSTYTVKVYDVRGQIILNQRYTEGGIKALDIPAESGIYMVEVTDANLRSTYRQKIVIQR